MLFNSFTFALFLPIVFALYWFVFNRSVRLQNAFIILASYLFYGWWDWRFLSLLAFSSIVDYFTAILIAGCENKRSRKVYFSLSVVNNLSILGIFKYFNFFGDSLSAALASLGISLDVVTLNVILPVGLSFYTFQTLSYTIDVYRGKLQPTKDVVAFCAYVSFFPQLVAGPIERATNLLPQFTQTRTFHYSFAMDGIWQMIWGFFMKIVIADNCAVYVNQVFSDPTNYGGSTLYLAVLLFAFQIYGDFAGYSNIAIGTSKLFGVRLMQNFAFPYFSRDIAEFWRRWHISLSTWFRDYVYIPLGGSQGSRFRRVRNTVVIFLLSGLWHGANWTFVLWGAVNALYFLPLLLLEVNRKHITVIGASQVPRMRELFGVFITFNATLFAWIFFRAADVSQAFQIIDGIFSPSIFSMPGMFPSGLLLGLGLFLCVEWIGRRSRYPIQGLSNRLPASVNFLIIYGLVLVFSCLETLRANLSLYIFNSRL